MDDEDICVWNEGEWIDTSTLRILNYKSLSSDNNSEKSFKGFGQSQNRTRSNRRIEDDLEIVEEVIRAVEPGKKRRCPIHSKVPYREKKMAFTYFNKVKAEKPDTPLTSASSSSSTNEDRVFVRWSHQKDDDIDNSTDIGKEQEENRTNGDPLDIVDVDGGHSSHSGSPSDLVTVEGLSGPTEQPEISVVDLIVSPSSHQTPTSSDKHRRSYAVMRPSVLLTDIMKNNKTGSSPRNSQALRTMNNENEVGKPKEKKIRKRNSAAEFISYKQKTTRSGSPRSTVLRTPLRSADVSLREEDESEQEEESNDNEDISVERRPPKRLCSFTNIINSNDFGRLVWGKSGSSRPWPAVIVNHVDCGERKPLADRAWLLWFGDYRITEVHLSHIKDFVSNYKNQFASTYHTEYRKAVLECLKECRTLSSLEEFKEDKEYLNWGGSGLQGVKIETIAGKSYCSAKVQQYLRRILKMRMRENSSSEISAFPTSSSSNDDSCAQERSVWKPKAALLKQVREGVKDIETICIACDRVDCEVAGPHPYFHGGTCENCKEELEDISSCTPDGLMYCLICGSPGELIVCDDDTCDRVFCTGCVELLVSPKAVREIMKADPWLCFLCSPYEKSSHGLLKPRPDWQEKVASTGAAKPTSVIPDVEDETPDISSFSKKPLRVLSLFDGIATGLLVLEKLGIDVEVYYASEINEDAMIVASENFGDRITYVGDVQTLSDKRIAELCPIDLLIGGSPCNDLSFVNPNRRGLFDPTGTGILFFHYFRALKTIQAKNGNSHLFWLFENVNHMPREFKTQMSIFLQREPCIIDAKHFSAQRRPRCFWGNIPDMYKPLPPEILNQTFNLENCIAKISQRTALVDKVNCITTNSNSLKPVVKMNDNADFPWITELEKIFGFPKHYTDSGNLNVRGRQALLGRSWSVQVINYILKPLKRYFPLKKASKDSVGQC